MFKLIQRFAHSLTHTHKHIQYVWRWWWNGMGWCGVVWREKRVMHNHTPHVYLYSTHISILYVLYRNDMGGNIKKGENLWGAPFEGFSFSCLSSFRMFECFWWCLSLEVPICVWKNFRSDRVSESEYLTFSSACFDVKGGWCRTIWCVNTHSQFCSHTLFALPVCNPVYSFVIFSLPLSLDTHSVMLFCWFEKFTFTLK